MGYLSQRPSTCQGSFRTRGRKAFEQPHHFWILKALPACYRLYACLQWDGGILELIRQECRFLTPEAVVHQPLVRDPTGLWQLAVKHIPGIPLNRVLRVDPAFKPTPCLGQATETYLHLNRGFQFYFERDDSLTRLDLPTWGHVQAGLGNLFYGAIGDELWTPRPYLQQVLNALEPARLELAELREDQQKHHVDVIEFQKTLQKKDDQVIELQGALRQKEEQVAKDREKHHEEVAELQGALQQKEEQVAELRKKHHEEVAELQRALQQKEEQVAELQRALQQKDEQVDELQAMLRQKDVAKEHLERLEQKIRTYKTQLVQLKHESHIKDQLIELLEQSEHAQNVRRAKAAQLRSQLSQPQAPCPNCQNEDSD